MLCINPPDKTKRQGISLQGPAAQVIPNSFVMLILGPPGSGKSHLITQLLDRSDFYGGKFDRVVYFGPTKYERLEQDEFNTIPQISQGVLQQLLEALNTEACPGYNALFVLDDLVGCLHENRSKAWLSNLFFNRRHLIKQGTLSLIVTSQKFNSVPTLVRTATTHVFTSKISSSQITNMSKDLNIGLPKPLLSHKIATLPKHSFLFADLQLGRVYNDKFICIS